uniref:MgtE domain-containing protein n=1 Tax=Heterorhabditis bacteriophora TaxID=37862 RepID=A0A1I7XP23_HETBA
MDSLIQQNKLRLNSDVLEKNSEKKKTDSSEEYLVSQISLEKMDLATISTAENTEQTSFIPFLIAGLGSIGAGLLLNHVQKFPIICAVPQFIALSPPLQGMKGNLDMTFTSRLSTMAHQGQLDSVNGRVTYVLRNMALIQAQAILISSFATVLTFLFSLLNTISDIEPLATNFLFLGSNALMAMSSACAIMAIAMVSLVMISRTAGINPDNVATPLAASIGDLLTIGSMVD